MAATTIPLQTKTRDRLKRFGHAGQTYDEIVQRLMDDADRHAFVAEMKRLSEKTTNWVDLDDV